MVLFPSLEKMRAELPELPWDKKDRLMRDYNLTSTQAVFLLLNSEYCVFFEEVMRHFKSDREKAIVSTYNYLTNDVKGILKEAKLELKDIHLTHSTFASLIIDVVLGKVSSRQAKDTLKELILKK